MAAEETIKATETQEVTPDTATEPIPEPEAPAEAAAAEPAPEETPAEPAPEAAAEPEPEETPAAEAPVDAAPEEPKAEAPTESMDDMGKDLEDSYKMMGDGVHDTDTLIAWSKIMELYEAGTDIETEVAGIVNKGVIVMIEGIRGFVPASRLSLKRVYDLNDWLGRKIKVRIITADPDNDKLVLSAREILQEERDNAKKEKISAVKVGEVFTGKVDSIQDYGVFVNLGNGLSGLVHISQISLKHIKHPSEELKVGDEVRVKVIGKQNGKLKLSMKALLEQKKKEDESRVEIPKAESVGTSLGDLLKNVKL